MTDTTKPKPKAPIIDVSGPTIVGDGPAYRGGVVPRVAAPSKPNPPPAWFGADRNRAVAPKAAVAPPPPPAPRSALDQSPVGAALQATEAELSVPAIPPPAANPFAIRFSPTGSKLTAAQTTTASAIVRTLRSVPDIRSQWIAYWAAYPADFIANAVAESSLNAQATVTEKNGSTSVGVFQFQAATVASLYAKRQRLGVLATRIAPPSPVPAFPDDILYAVLLAADLSDWIGTALDVTWAPGSVPTGTGVPVSVKARDDQTAADFLIATKSLSDASGVPLDLVWLRCWWKASSPKGALSVARSAAGSLVATRAKTALNATLNAGFQGLR